MQEKLVFKFGNKVINDALSANDGLLAGSTMLVASFDFKRWPMALRGDGFTPEYTFIKTRDKMVLTLMRQAATYNRPLARCMGRKPAMVYVRITEDFNPFQLRIDREWFWNGKDRESDWGIRFTHVGTDEGAAGVIAALETLSKNEDLDIQFCIVDEPISLHREPGQTIDTVVRELRTYFAVRGIAGIIPHPIRINAAQIAAAYGRSDLVANIGGKGWLKGSRSLENQVDVVLYVDAMSGPESVILTGFIAKQRSENPVNKETRCFTIVITNKDTLQIDDDVIDAEVQGPKSHALIRRAVQWNVPVNGRPLPAMECEDHPLVSGTSPVEIHRILNGSPKLNDQLWDWRTLGVIRLQRGTQLVYPGDWIVEFFDGVAVVMSDGQYRAL